MLPVSHMERNEKSSDYSQKCLSSIHILVSERSDNKKMFKSLKKNFQAREVLSFKNHSSVEIPGKYSIHLYSKHLRKANFTYF